MKARAALLLLAVIFVFAEAGILLPLEPTSTTTSEFRKKEVHVSTTRTSESPEVKTTTSPTTTIHSNAFLIGSDIIPPFTNPKDMLLEEIRSLDEDASTNKQIQEELAKAIKAEAQKSRDKPRTSSLKPLRARIVEPTPNAIDVNDKLNAELDKDQDAALKALKQAEISFNEDNDDDDDDDDEDDDDDDDDVDTADEYDDDDEDDEEDDIADEEEIMTECPDYCRCSGQYAAATTARCSKLIAKQNFGPQIAHLRIENAGEIALGPQALRNRGLQQLESITITDTRIASLHKSAFNGTDYLFAVNLTRTALIDIDPDYFVNNTQLSLLTIAGQPLGPSWISSKEYLLNAPSVTELDFSSNEISRLPRAAFSKMPNLAYVDLKNNRLKNIEDSILESMDSLVELDLSGNLLSEFPASVVDGKGLQTLRIASNNLTKLSPEIFTKMSTLPKLIIGQISKLTTLDASNNRIKVITKDDLAAVASLEKLIVSSNGMKRIHQHAFSILDQLTYLDISDNRITNLTEHHLRSNPRLQVLLMSNNPSLEALPVFKTIGFEYDTYSVYRLECANCGLLTLSEGTFDAMPALTRLNLAKNHLSGFPPGLLQSLSSLRELDLSDNSISVIEPKMFAGARTMLKLNLAGNPLISLHVTPFLQTPGLARLDVSRCHLRRIWSEARQPLKSLRFLSVRANDLQRITLEELKAMPKLSGLDASHNPFSCDEDFNQAVQWLINHGVTPTEELKYISNYGNAEDYAEADGVQWTDLAKAVCDNEDDGPPSRNITHKTNDYYPIFDYGHNGISEPADTEILRKDPIDNKFADIFKDDYNEYDDLNALKDEVEADYTTETHSWYTSDIVGWRVMAVIMAVLTLVIAVCYIARVIAKSRGRGPVIRPPMILRQGLVDNKNCGLVYKPLQEEIATPHMPKRGSFYSSSTFHYDKIVPESV